MSVLITGIKYLACIQPNGKLRLDGPSMERLRVLEDAWLLVENGLIAAFGPKGTEPGGESVLDAEGGTVLPSFCDSHTHLVFAGSREREFVDKIAGKTYEQIAENGGGILNSADRLRSISEDELYETSMKKIREVISKGTGAIEIKSGYGLSTESEIKMLRVIRRIKANSPLLVRSTFLGAHAVAREYRGRQNDYVKMLCEEMLPAVANEGLADYIDVFCDKGFFTEQETETLLEKGKQFGLRGKIHGDELASTGGTRVAIRMEALSVDHLERISDEDIELLRESEVMPTLLPGASFFLGMPYAPAKKIISRGIGIALASDFNPGSSPSGDMKFILSLGCIKMKLTPTQALNACTINGAYAMGVSGEVGSITVGKRANLIITQPIPSIDYIPYAYTTPIIRYHLLNGVLVSD
ncbi:MAG: imidazolonepropionase [Muribaculaceae bacterium]|nr:imidazolonepropionase [Muribaculaceae bacterium]